MLHCYVANLINITVYFIKTTQLTAIYPKKRVLPHLVILIILAVALCIDHTTCTSEPSSPNAALPAITSTPSTGRS